MTKRNRNRAELVKEIARRAAFIQSDTQTSPEQKKQLLEELFELGRRAIRGGVPREDWMNHELNWMAYGSNLRCDLLRAIARAVIEFERNAAVSADAEEFNDDNREILTWWHYEGGRELLLRELPIAERRELERLA